MIELNLYKVNTDNMRIKDSLLLECSIRCRYKKWNIGMRRNVEKMMVSRMVRRDICNRISGTSKVPLRMGEMTRLKATR